MALRGSLFRQSLIPGTSLQHLTLHAPLHSLPSPESLCEVEKIGISKKLECNFDQVTQEVMYLKNYPQFKTAWDSEIATLTVNVEKLSAFNCEKASDEKSLANQFLASAKNSMELVEGLKKFLPQVSQAPSTFKRLQEAAKAIQLNLAKAVGACIRYKGILSGGDIVQNVINALPIAKKESLARQNCDDRVWQEISKEPLTNFQAWEKMVNDLPSKCKEREKTLLKEDLKNCDPGEDDSLTPQREELLQRMKLRNVNWTKLRKDVATWTFNCEKVRASARCSSHEVEKVNAMKSADDLKEMCLALSAEEKEKLTDELNSCDPQQYLESEVIAEALKTRRQERESLQVDRAKLLEEIEVGKNPGKFEISKWRLRCVSAIAFLRCASLDDEERVAFERQRIHQINKMTTLEEMLTGIAEVAKVCLPADPVVKVNELTAAEIEQLKAEVDKCQVDEPARRASPDSPQFLQNRGLDLETLKSQRDSLLTQIDSGGPGNLKSDVAKFSLRCALADAHLRCTALHLSVENDEVIDEPVSDVASVEDVVRRTGEVNGLCLLGSGPASSQALPPVPEPSPVFPGVDEPIEESAIDPHASTAVSTASGDSIAKATNPGNDSPTAPKPVGKLRQIFEKIQTWKNLNPAAKGSLALAALGLVSAKLLGHSWGNAVKKGILGAAAGGLVGYLRRGTK